jgi:predicted aconitase with swiveling domain
MSKKKSIFPARKLTAGVGEGEALVTENPLTFWGGMDPTTGTIIDAHHELCGKKVSGKVLVFPYGAGSSSGCGVIMEMVRLGTHPAAMVNVEKDPVLALGPILAQELYGRSLPIVTVSKTVFKHFRKGDTLKVDANKGRIVCLRKGLDK